MEIFGMGPAEILLILIIALVVFGPNKLPEIGRSIGKIVGDFRRASRNLTADLGPELKSARAEITGAFGEVQSGFQETIDTTGQAVSDLSKEVNALPAAAQSSPAAKAPAASRPTTSSRPAGPPAEEVDADTAWLRLGQASEE